MAAPVAPPVPPVAHPVVAPRPRVRARARSATVLVVEHASAEGTPHAQVLARAGFAVRHVATPAAARATSWSGLDGVVLDADAAGGDALDVIAALAAPGGRARILVVAAPAALPDRVTVMLAGADDVVAKPVCTRELVARVESLTTMPVVEAVPPLEVGCLAIDRNRKQVAVDGTEVTLSALQYELLVALAEADGRPVPGRTLLARHWDPHQDVGSGNLRPQMARIRRALGERCEITWIRGAGYVLRCAP